MAGKEGVINRGAVFTDIDKADERATRVRGLD